MTTSQLPDGLKQLAGSDNRRQRSTICPTHCQEEADPLALLQSLCTHVLQGNATDVQSWWMKTAVHCCKCSYQDLVGAMSDALAYQTYLEMGAAALILALYLGLYKKGESCVLLMEVEQWRHMQAKEVT